MEREKEKVATLAPERLSRLVEQGLRGHHLLFDRAAILAAFDANAPVAREDADAVGQALLAVCQEPLAEARATVASLPASARLSLVRLYFRLLERAQEESPLHH